MIALTARPIQREGQTHRVGVGIGIACFPAEGADLSRLMRHADLALYQVKRSGWGRFAFHEDLSPQETSQMGVALTSGRARSRCRVNRP